MFKIIIDCPLNKKGRSDWGKIGSFEGVGAAQMKSINASKVSSMHLEKERNASLCNT